MSEITATGSKNTKTFGIVTIVLGALAIAAPMVAGVSVALL